MVRKIYVLSIFLLGLLIFSGCEVDGGKDSDSKNLSFNVLFGYQYLEDGSFTSKGVRIIKSESDYIEQAAKYISGEPVAVDFSESSVLLADMGVRTTGGHNIGVTKVVEYDDYVIATVALSKPGNNCNTTTALTNPYVFIEIPSSKEILVNEKLVVEDCNY